MKDFFIAVWSWLVTPVGETEKAGHRATKPPQTLEGGRYKGKHRRRRTIRFIPEAGAWFATPEAGAWFAQHQQDFAQAYARAQGRAA